MKIGQIYRYAKTFESTKQVIDGFPNYLFHTCYENFPKPLLERGINPIGQPVGGNTLDCPAILISSSPHKTGSKETPWQDHFAPDVGHIRYFGDNKKSGVSPELAKGNKALLKEFKLHSSIKEDDRRRSCPIVCFRATRVNGKAKGYRQFMGFGIIESVELVTQINSNGEPFTNYAFDFLLFNMHSENEEFNWDWINQRRLSNASLESILKVAPRSWQIWVKEGKPAHEKCRRKVVKLLTTPTSDQVASLGTTEDKILKKVYSYYEGKKARFEALAAFIAKQIISESGSNYSAGWITASTSDGGADFIGRIDIGSGLAKVKIIVLGQAKCEKLDTATSGNHIARTVARLKRGWIGVYVTTSYFSEAVQREVLEDKYPIMLINGVTLAKSIDKIMNQDGYAEVEEFLDKIDSKYEEQVKSRQPEELLLEN